MNYLVKILTSNDGEIRDNPKWHLSTDMCGDKCTLCESEYYGFGASGCKFETKQVEKGGITCDKCIDIIKNIKQVKL